MTLDESVHGLRLRVIERAQVLGNVSAVCRELGISRTVFYRWRTRLERYGVEGVHPRRQRAGAGRPVATPPEVERLVLGIAISAATWGCRRIAAYLARTWQIRLAPSTVQRLLRRVGLATRRARLTVLEQQAARTAGLLTERTRAKLWRARHGRTRHVEATEPGQLVCLDTFYIGNLKGVGKVWQITACDAATSYGLAGLLPVHDAAAAATFLREVVVTHFQRAGWRCGAYSPTAARNSRAPLMGPAASSASAIRGRNRVMPGPTGSSNACRARFSRSSGASSSVAATSPVARRCSGPSTTSCATTTTNGLTKAIVSAVGPRPRSSGAWPLSELIHHHSGTAKVSTPFRVWTA
jgi:transposase